MSFNSGSGQQRPCSDCADAQADLRLRCPHMPKDTLSLGASQINKGNRYKSLSFGHLNPYHVCSKLRKSPFTTCCYFLTLKIPRKPASEKCRLFMSSAEYSCKLFKPIFAYRQTVWTPIRLLLEESDRGPHCLQK